MHGVRALQLTFSWLEKLRHVSKEKAMFEVVSGHCKNKGNDHRLILIVCTIGNAKRSGVKG